MFHKHKWVERERFYAPPVAGDVSGTSRIGVERLRFGLTTIAFDCSCGEMFTQELLGQVWPTRELEDGGFDMLDKHAPVL